MEVFFPSKVIDKQGIEHNLTICPVCGYFYDKDREEQLHQAFHKKTVKAAIHGKNQMEAPK